MEEKFEISKFKVGLFLTAILLIVFCLFVFGKMQHKYDIELVKNNMKIEYLDYDFINSETLKVDSLSKARSILKGGPFKFDENIELSSGIIVNVKNKGFIDDITNGEIMVDFMGHDYVDRNKYMALYITVYNNTEDDLILDGTDFEIGYRDNNMYIKKNYNDGGLTNVKNIFSLNTISAYTKREGYIFIPIENNKLEDYYFKILINNTPIIYSN